MKLKCTVFAILSVFLVLVVSPSGKAVDTKSIDEVLRKGVLGDADFQVIDSFVGDAVRELVNTRDFTSVAKLRTVILSRSSSSVESAEAQYAKQFSKSAYGYISSALKEAEGFTPEDRKFKAIVNLLILIDGLAEPELAKLALDKVGSDNKAIRYWAVHGVTNPVIAKKLSSLKAENLKLAVSIVKELEKLVLDAEPDVLVLIAKFGGALELEQGEKLLLEIADMRIKKYAEWKVDNELLDGTVLKLLYDKISSSTTDKSDVGRRFAQLYSYIMQKYIKWGNVLSDTEKSRLASVLVEVESCCIWRILGTPQTKIKRAIEEGDLATLLLEHSRLLGDKTRAGELALKLKFDYGLKANGKRRIEPAALPEPPQAKAS